MGNRVTMKAVAEKAGVSASALRHDQACPAYNLHFRQFIHVSFKIAAKMGGRYTEALKSHREAGALNVTENLLVRHIRLIFG